MQQEGAIREIETDDAYKREVQNQWTTTRSDRNAAQRSRIRSSGFHEWSSTAIANTHVMPEVMEFTKHADEQVLEIAAECGRNLRASSRSTAAIVTDVDLSAGQSGDRPGKLQAARAHRPVPASRCRVAGRSTTNTFDLVYSNGVIHHTPNTKRAVAKSCASSGPVDAATSWCNAENSLSTDRRFV